MLIVYRNRFRSRAYTRYSYTIYTATKILLVTYVGRDDFGIVTEEPIVHVYGFK